MPLALRLPTACFIKKVITYAYYVQVPMSKRTTNLPPTHDMKPHKKFNYPKPVGTSLTIHVANKKKLSMETWMNYPCH
jgi:hypothetical protein